VDSHFLIMGNISDSVYLAIAFFKCKGKQEMGQNQDA